MRHFTIVACLSAWALACSNGAGPSDDDTGEGSGSPTATTPEGGSSVPTGPGGAACSVPSPGEAPLRRLTNAEYRNTMADLVKDTALVEAATRSFPQEPTSLGFRTSAEALTVTPLIADEYIDAAIELGKAFVDQEGAVPCSLETSDPDCTLSFVQDFGKHVYRRPLTQAELRRYSDQYGVVLTETGSVRTAYQTLLSTMFSSPHFLFRVELSQPANGDVGQPNGYEMASRLSYLLWQTMPDETLFAAAEAGELETKEGIEAQVRRMMADEKALRVYEFFEQWLDLDEAVALTRSETTYPDFNAGLIDLLRAENRAFVYHLLGSNGTLADLLSAEYTFANAGLATHYGLADAPSGATFERVEAPGRAGVLTQAALLVHDRPARTSIVKRGLKLRTDFFCQIVPAPPANVDTTLPELDGDLTQRERLEQHRADPSCAGCHALIDPLGEIFEGFDALGRPRSVDEAGAAVVSGGAVTATRTLNGQYASPRELALAMGQSDEVRQCFALQAFRFFYGRDATKEDACTQTQLMESFARNDYRLVDLLIGLTRSDQFLYRTASPVDAPNGETP